MSPFLVSTVRYVRSAFAERSLSGHSQRRDARIVQGIFSALAGKGVAAIVSFLSVPLTVGYLGAERYGVWVTISTMIAWAALADFGLGNSLTNAVSEGYAKEDRNLAQGYVAAAFWSLAAVAILLGLIFFSIWSHVPWNRVFNVRSTQAAQEVAPAVAVAFAIFVLNFPFSIVQKIYGAYQEVAWSNGWTAAGNLVGLGALIVVAQRRGGLVALVIAVSGAGLLMNMISAVWLFIWSKRWLFPHPRRVTWAASRKLTSLGGMFFLIQVSALILFQTDNLIIAHYMGAAAVTPYSVTWRLFSYTALFQIVAIPSYWPAYAEAFSRGDRAWIRLRYRSNLRISIGSTFMLAFPLVFLGRWIIQKWAGSAAVPSESLIIWMGLWSLIFSAMNSQSCLLVGSGRVKAQTIYSAAASAVNLVLSIILVQRLGLVGVIIGTVAAFAVCVIVPQSFEVDRAIRM